MKNDVFISYSSKQKVIAEGIRHYLEEHLIKCWMAPDSIPPSSSYPEVINRAISDSQICLLIYSDTASMSPWIKKEVNQAINVGKPVLPFRIEVTAKSDFFDFILSDIHWIDAYPHYAEKLPSLLKAICALIGKEVSNSGLTENQDIANARIPDDLQDGYCIGDIISCGKTKGVVFYLDESRMHGKIVSLEHTIKQWCTQREYLLHRDTNAIIDDDGMENLKRIQQIPDWETSYPAFKWCAKLGKEWYLPTVDDLRLIDKERSAVEDKIGGIEETQWYWSSEQESVYSAKYYHFLSGQASGLGKDNECNVLAVADF